ncbi:hypothetical protein RJD24_17395 [Bacillaceae bacterium IKA-2]|nr:hypothetical protein RJD24_17395 [Bacillaceae bacterium IKA-2]
MSQKLVKVFLLLSLFLTFSHVVLAEEYSDKMYYILSDTCSVCAEVSIYLDELEEEGNLTYEVIRLEVRRDREEVIRVKEEYDVDEMLVPLFIFEDKHILGFNSIVERELTDRLTSGVGRVDVKKSGFFDRNLEDAPLILATVLIGTVDGFNPCSLWALMFLVSMVIRFNSRRKMAIVGGTYILTIALIYGLFMVGTFSIVILIIDYFWFRFALFSLGMLVAIVNIREGLGLKSSLSFSIKDDNKKSFVKKIRDRLFRVESMFGIILASVTIGAFASFIELPCTAGFPIIWNGLVSSHGVGLAEYGFYLMVYLTMYISMEVLIVIFMIWTMRKAFMGEFIGGNLKLVSGLLMGFLAIILLLGYEYMNNMWIVLGGSLLVLGATIIFMIVKKIISKKKK